MFYSKNFKTENFYLMMSVVVAAVAGVNFNLEFPGEFFVLYPFRVT